MIWGAQQIWLGLQRSQFNKPSQGNAGKQFHLPSSPPGNISDSDTTARFRGRVHTFKGQSYLEKHSSKQCYDVSYMNISYMNKSKVVLNTRA